MKCEDCRYFYLEMRKEQRNIYCGLSGCDRTIYAEGECRMCGYSPTGAFLDDNQPVCAEFTLKANDALKGLMSG
jgi:hypothetical protein